MNHLHTTPIIDNTVNAEEVQFYQALADKWWDRDGPFWPLHRLNELRVCYLRERLAPLLRRSRSRLPFSFAVKMVDIGCGGGILSESMARLGAQVTAIDVVDKNIEAARQHSRGSGLAVDYRLATVSDLRESGKFFDVVLNMEVVEHVADLPLFMKDCCRLVRPGGIMVVATINRTLLSYLIAILGAEYMLRWLPRGTHRWRQFRKPTELTQLLAAGGLHVADKVGVRVNPVTKRFATTKLDPVNYMLIALKV